MSPVLPVPVIGDLGADAAVLASLPLSYARGADVSGSVAIVKGSSDWPTTAEQALEAGSAAVIVTHPAPADTGRLRDGASRVFLDTLWSANPVISSAAAALRAALPYAERLECGVRRPVGSDLESTLLDQLLLVRALVGAVGEVRVLTRSAHGYCAEGVAAGHPVDLSLVCTDATPESAWVRLITGDGSVELTIPSGSTARPAELTTTGPYGRTLAPTLYESGRRATWRRVAAALGSGPSSNDLGSFAADADAARAALEITEGQASYLLAPSTPR